VVTVDDFLHFEPTDAADDVGVILYPGGLVDPEAYALPARALAEAGVPTVVVPMPSDLAVLAPNRAADVIASSDAASRWVMAGHSLGGAMAASFVQDAPPEVQGLSLWAAYPAKSVDLSASTLVVQSIRASEDGVLDLVKWEERTSQLPADTQFHVIEGGNHAGFAGYGPQDDDGSRTIDLAEQQAALVSLVLELVQAL
jgi:dienelactone hydrolase